MYVVGLQAVAACVFAAVVTVLASWLPAGARSAVRSLGLASLAGCAVLYKPLKFGGGRVGEDAVFSVLRPCIAIYLGALTIEQLLDTCVYGYAPTGRHWRAILLHVCSGVAALSGLIRAWNPRSDLDSPVLLTAAAMATAAMFPPPGTPGGGRLCSPASLPAAAEQATRALLFAVTYSAHVYAGSTPISSDYTNAAISVLRAGAASVWILCGHAAMLFAAPFQITILVCRSFVVAAAEPSDEGGDAEAPLVEKAAPLAVRASSADRRLTVSLGLGKNA